MATDDVDARTRRTVAALTAGRHDHLHLSDAEFRAWVQQLARNVVGLVDLAAVDAEQAGVEREAAVAAARVAAPTHPLWGAGGGGPRLVKDDE